MVSVLNTESNPMEGFEQEKDKPDLHILTQPLVLDIHPLLSASGNLLKNLKMLDPAGSTGQE